MKGVRTAKIARKEKQLDHLEEKLLKLSDDTRKKTKELKLESEMDRSSRLASARRKAHALNAELDDGLRSSDKCNNLRSYTKMDADIWKYEDVRQWFNKYSTEDSCVYKLRPADTGYVIRFS